VEVRTIGVISDTHGLLRDEAVEALGGSDLILHAGDVGDMEVLRHLGDIAPVRAVRGNTDFAELSTSLPDTDVVDLTSPDGALSREGRGPIAYLIHGHLEMALDPAAAGFRVVISGHTHLPHMEDRLGVMYFNPGSAGPRRSGHPVSLGRLTVEDGEVMSEIVILEVD